MEFERFFLPIVLQDVCKYQVAKSLGCPVLTGRVRLRRRAKMPCPAWLNPLIYPHPSTISYLLYPPDNAFFMKIEQSHPACIRLKLHDIRKVLCRNFSFFKDKIQSLF